MASTEDLSFAYIKAHPGDAARVLERLPPQPAAALISAAPVLLAAPVLRHMVPLHAARCLERLDDEAAAGLLRATGPQAGVALLRYMPESRRVQLLAQLPTALAVTFRLLLGYSPDTVGAWMDTGVLALPSDLLCGVALESVRESGQESVVDLYVLDAEQRLLGSVELTDLVRAEPGTPLARLMHSPPAYVLPAQSLLTSVREHAGWGEHRMLPVVERGGRLIGALSHAVLVRALTDGNTRQGPDTGYAIAGMAGAYWFGVSTMIETLVGMLPAPQQGVSGEAHERKS